MAVGSAEGAADVLAAAVAADAMLAAVVAVVGVVLEVAVAAGVAVAVLGCTPITCSSDCNRLPNRFCAVPAGTCAAVSVLESVVGST
jgi:hypothetical protein